MQSKYSAITLARKLSRLDIEISRKYSNPAAYQAGCRTYVNETLKNVQSAYQAFDFSNLATMLTKAIYYASEIKEKEPAYFYSALYNVLLLAPGVQGFAHTQARNQGHLNVKAFSEAKELWDILETYGPDGSGIQKLGREMVKWHKGDKRDPIPATPNLLTDAIGDIHRLFICLPAKDIMRIASRAPISISQSAPSP